MTTESRSAVGARGDVEYGRDPDPATFVGVNAHWYVTNTGGVVLNGVLAATTKRRSFQLLFWGAIAVHVAEAAYAYRVARRAGFTESAPRWALQTLAVGLPSLLALRKARA
jgi:hypothetical protein